MFDIGGGELLVIGIVALVVIGPKELPGLLRTAGNAMGKLRRMAAEFRGQFDEAMREAEVEEAKKAFASVDDAARSATTGGFNPLDTIRNEIKAVKDEIKASQPQAGQPEAGIIPAPISAAVDPPVISTPPIELPPPPAVLALEPPAEPAPREPAKPKRSRKAAKDSTGSPA